MCPIKTKSRPDLSKISEHTAKAANPQNNKVVIKNLDQWNNRFSWNIML